MEAEAETTAENNRVPGRPFEKGDPRINRKGRPPGSVSVVDEIRRQLQEVADEDPQKRTKLQLLVKKLVLKAINEGDTAMIRDIIDRIDGKPKQSIDINTPDEDVWEKLEELEKTLKNDQA